jgi:hypothetical protein
MLRIITITTVLLISCSTILSSQWIKRTKTIAVDYNQQYQDLDLLIYNNTTKLFTTISKDSLSQNIVKEKAYINYFDFESNLTTVISTSDTWVALNATTTSLFSNNGLEHTNNRVTNTGSKRIFEVSGIIALQGGKDVELHAAFFRNGFLYPCSEASTPTVTHGSVFFTSTMPFHCIIELDTNDFVEVYVKNSINTSDIILKNVNVIVKEL